jgi:hypothetical protein
VASLQYYDIKVKSMVYAVYKIVWREFERGWGVRPDGYSLHATSEDAHACIQRYWKNMPDEAPDEYSKPGNPILVEVDKLIYEKVQKEINVRY